MAGELHRLPGVRRDDREPILIVTTRADLRALLEELRGGDEKRKPERPLTVKEFAALYGVSSKRVYGWIDRGMPRIKTGAERGVVIWPEDAHPWIEEHYG